MDRPSVSASPTSPDLEVRRLIDEGYDVALVDGMLAISHVPYVRAAGTLAYGTLMVPLTMVGNEVTAPDWHTAWWVGEAPREADGTPLRALNVSEGAGRRISGMAAAALVCAKPHGREYRDHHEFVTTYVAIISVPASIVDPSASARTHRIPPPVEMRSGAFAYADTATRARGSERRPRPSWAPRWASSDSAGPAHTSSTS